VQARSRCYAGRLLLSLSAIPIIYVGIIIHRNTDCRNNVRLTRLAASAPHNCPVASEYENSRRAQYVKLPHQVETGLGVDLHMCHARGQSRDIGEDPAGSPARRAERGRELQQRRPLPEQVPDVVATELPPCTGRPD